MLLYATQASGGPGTTIETRWAHHETLARAGLTRLALVDPGSVSLGGDRVYINTHADASYGFERCAALGLVPSISIFDPSFLRVALAHELPPGALIKFYFGGPAMPFGLPPTPASLDAYLAMLDGTGLPWLVAVLGGDVRELAPPPWRGRAHPRRPRGLRRTRTPRNVELVEEAAALVAEHGRHVASPRKRANPRPSLRARR